MIKFKIQHLQDYIDGKLELVPKSLGLELVELGFLDYSKLTPDNYEYWWCEAKDNSKFNKNNFTFDWSDLKPTRKFSEVKKYIHKHKPNESMYRLITAILNIEAARFDGVDMLTNKPAVQQVESMYYN